MAKLRYLHIMIPQGTQGNPKLESKFQELLVNMRNTFTGKRVSLEFFGFAQYTYFFIVTEDKVFETIEGLVYATFPEAEMTRWQGIKSGEGERRTPLSRCDLFDNLKIGGDL